jgi:predicted nucleotidyltransferase
VEKDYEEFLKLLNRHRIQYCIVGAYAVAFHARPRYTKDIDILIEVSKDNACKMIQALDEFGFGDLELTEEDFLKEGLIIQLGYEPVRIDLLTTISGCTFKEIWDHKKFGDYGDEKVIFIGKEELIKSKKAAGRKQDEADLELLQK